jgi:tRNA1Val (adenine37-N6)-methyltransferase
MPNTFFSFKQFTIQQSNCAMKVTTDACIFGATVAKHLHQKITIKNICDIGTGTGVLSLMIAQKNDICIDAIEIDSNAYEQAKQNFLTSEFKNQLTIYNADILQFESRIKYDFIFTNPPFFEADLKSENSDKNNAKHDTSLTLATLLQRINLLLKDDGSFLILLPYHRINYFETEANKNGFYLQKSILVKQTPNHNYFRGILFFSKSIKNFEPIELIIKDEADKYSTDFCILLKDYYLYL